MHKTIAIALSGGVDSLVSAYLLKNQGHRVIGLHFITGYEAGFQTINDGPVSLESGAVQAIRDDMNRLGDRLHIPIDVIDISKEFKSRVIDYFIRTYGLGKTPNPCMVCNPAIKFGVLYDQAKKLGADRLATGHYVRIGKDEKGRYHLKKGLDPVKDQSYFLARLNQSQLASAQFPLGELTKPQVVALAKTQGLTPLLKTESQDICFIREADTYADFLAREAGIKDTPGPIVDMEGHLLGEHTGLHRFTIGQRRGINCPAREPYYVIRIEPEENRLVVGLKHHLFLPEFTVSDINWIGEPPGCASDAMTRVRYRHKAVESIVTPTGNGYTAHVKFSTPQSAITPGQGAVFYRGDDVLGGGWIER
jgi:tRNA-uridine 2-sulfurtransferase